MDNKNNMNKMNKDIQKHFKKMLSQTIDTYYDLFYETNESYMIYYNLYEKIKCIDVNEYLENNPCVQDRITNYLYKIRNNNMYLVEKDLIKRRLIGYHLLGDYLEDVTYGRFVKEKAKGDDTSEYEHIKEWFEHNDSLKFDTDVEIIQSGYLTLFFILQDNC